MNTIIGDGPGGTITVAVDHPRAWPERDSAMARQIRAAAVEALRGINGLGVVPDSLIQYASDPDRTVFVYDRVALTLADVVQLIRGWSASDDNGGDLDAFLEEKLTGRRLTNGKYFLTVTGVINSGFNGQAIHGTIDGHPTVIYVR